MKIGINARQIQNRHTGPENYMLNLILNLKRIDKNNEYVLFFGKDRPVPEAILNAGFDYDISRMPTHNQLLKILWAHLYLPNRIRAHRIDLFHEPSFVAPVFKRCPMVTTVYDIAHLYFPFCYTRRTRAYLNRLLPRSIRQSDLLIAISESTKNDIIDHFGIPPEKVHVVHGGVDPVYRTIEDEERLEEVRKAYRIKGDFILTVGGITPRKNLIRLIRAFKMLRDDRKIDCQLVIVGKKGWLYEGVFKEAAASGLEDSIIFCDYIPKDHLLYLYNAAAVFAYPSLYEGFGLPILEAMACGCPVVASNRSSMPEVCGKAALLIDPEDVEGLSEALFKAVTDSPLREDLIKEGYKQVEKFSWERAADKTLAVYKRLDLK